MYLYYLLQIVAIICTYNVVHYKTVCNNNLIFNNILKLMPPYWDNKALPTPTLTIPDTFIFNFLIISLCL